MITMTKEYGLHGLGGSQVFNRSALEGVRFAKLSITYIDPRRNIPLTGPSIRAIWFLGAGGCDGGARIVFDSRVETPVGGGCKNVQANLTCAEHSVSSFEGFPVMKRLLGGQTILQFVWDGSVQAIFI